MKGENSGDADSRGFLGSLAGTFCIDHRGKGATMKIIQCIDSYDSGKYIPFVAECNDINDPYVEGDEETSRLLVPKGSGEETKGASNVHRVIQDVEWEPVKEANVITLP